jgi:hypothetical protein
VAASSFLRVLAATPTQDLNPSEDPVLQEEITARLDYMAELANLDVNLRVNYEGHELLYHALLGTYNFTDMTTYGIHIFDYDPSDTHDFVEGLSMYTTQGLPVAADGAVVVGCVPSQLVIEFQPRDYVREAWSFVGGGVEWTTIPTPTFPTRLPVIGRHAGNGTVTIGNAAVSLRSGRVTLTFPRDEDTYNYGDSIRTRPERIDRPRITFEGEVEWDNASNAGQDLMKDLGNYGAAGEHAMTISHLSDDDIPGAGVKYGFTFAADFDVMGDLPSVQDNGLVRANLRATVVTGTSPSPPSITVTNSITTQVTS